VWTGVVITLIFVFPPIFAPVISPYAFDQYKTADGVRFEKQEAALREHPFGRT